MVVKSLRRPQCILGQPRTSCGTSSFFLQFTTIAHVIQTIIYSAIWFELSNRTVTLSHVTRKVTRNHQTLGSFHMWDGLGMRLVADITSVPILRVTIMCTKFKFNEEYAASHTPFINHVTTFKELQHENFVIRFFMKMTWSHIVMIFSLFSTDCTCPENELYCAQILNSNTDTTMELRRRTEPSWEGWSKPKQKGVEKLLRNVVNLPPLSWSVRWPPWGPPGWQHLGPGPSDSPCRYEPGEQRDLDIKSPPRVTKPFNGVMSSWVVIPQRERYGVHTERGALGA